MKPRHARFVEKGLYLFVLAVNTGIVLLLVLQIRNEKTAYMELRSEDGFLFLESVNQSLQAALTRLEQDAGRLELEAAEPHLSEVLTPLADYQDIVFIQVESLGGPLFGTEPNPLAAGLGGLGEDPLLQEAVYGGAPFTREITFQGEDVLECVAPLYRDRAFVALLRIGLSLEFVEYLESSFRNIVLVALGFILLLDLIFVYAILISKRLGREGARFRAIMNEIGDGVLVRDRRGRAFRNRSLEVLLGSGAEKRLRNLPTEMARIRHHERTLLVLRDSLPDADVFIVKDISLETIAEETRQRERRLFSMGWLSSTFAHEIRNPLNTVSMIIQQLRLESTLPEQEQQLCDILHAEIGRLNNTVSEFIQVARQPAVEMQDVDMEAFLGEIHRFYAAGGTALDLEILCPADSDLIVRMDVEKMKGVLINLVENSRQAQARHIRITCRRQPPFAVLDVSDDGEGMSPQVRERAFELYFTTRPEGSGLGLATVHRLVVAHGGMVDIESTEGRGTSIFLYLPLSKGETPDEASDPGGG
ncbi:MAG: ATP-binding protein [Acidobacteria bacterium]|nr:ATP-binding protein [Acidobacteriota bacterium]